MAEVSNTQPNDNTGNINKTEETSEGKGRTFESCRARQKSCSKYKKLAYFLRAASAL